MGKNGHNFTYLCPIIPGISWCRQPWLFVYTGLSLVSRFICSLFICVGLCHGIHGICCLSRPGSLLHLGCTCAHTFFKEVPCDTFSKWSISCLFGTFWIIQCSSLNRLWDPKSCVYFQIFISAKILSEFINRWLKIAKINLD